MRPIDADALLKKTINNPLHAPYIVEKDIRGMPIIQPEPQWIPVSEGLPKKDGRYQVTRHDYVTNTEFIDILWYEKNTWWDRQATGDYAVTAWMPLPAPYKKGAANA